MVISKKEMEKLIGFNMRKMSGIGFMPSVEARDILERASFKDIAIAIKRAEIRLFKVLGKKR